MTSREPIQVRVVIVEARALKGQEGESDLVNPAVRINLEAGPIKRSLRTNIFRDVSSVFFNETKVFQEDIGTEEFKIGRIQLQVEDDQGLFQPRLIGETSFDLYQVHASMGHEIFNKWVILLHPDKGGEIQGFLRVCLTVLKSGELAKTHTRDELDDDGPGDGPDGQAGMMVGLPNVNVEPQQVTVRIYRAEISSYRQALPDAQVEIYFAGTNPVRSGTVRATYSPTFSDELLLPIYLPTFADDIHIRLINKAADDAVIAKTKIGLLNLRSEAIDPAEWINMYGPRPKPLSLGAEAGKLKEFAYDKAVKLSSGAVPERIPPPEVDSSWRARLLLYANIEPTGARSPKLQRKPMILSAAQIEDVEPETSEWELRCDLFEAIGWKLPPMGAMYVVLAWGPTERKSKVCSPDAGKIIFDSPLPAKARKSSHCRPASAASASSRRRRRRRAAASPQPLPRLCAHAQVGCYELLDPIVSEESELVAQHYDIFLHVYAATPTGDTRLGFRRFQPRRLMEDCGWDLAHSNADPNQP